MKCVREDDCVRRQNDRSHQQSNIMCVWHFNSNVNSRFCINNLAHGNSIHITLSLAPYTHTQRRHTFIIMHLCDCLYALAYVVHIIFGQCLNI